MGSEDRKGERLVLMLIGGGIIGVLMAIIGSMTLADNLPSWAETVFASITGGLTVKLADVLSALVQLSTGRQISRMSEQLGSSAPALTVPPKVEVVNTANNPVQTEQVL